MRRGGLAALARPRGATRSRTLAGWNPSNRTFSVYRARRKPIDDERAPRIGHDRADRGPRVVRELHARSLQDGASLVLDDAPQCLDVGRNLWSAPSSRSSGITAMTGHIVCSGMNSR